MLEIIAGVDRDRKIIAGQHRGEARRQLGAADTTRKSENVGHRNMS
jgi:hypothetical protein